MQAKTFLKLLGVCLFLGFASLVAAQDPNADSSAQKDEEPITGGVNYNPNPDDTGKYRDPFKTPFEIEQERKEENKANQVNGLPGGDRLKYDLGELDLKGIYLDAKTGYWAIFDIGGDYKWYQVGTLFNDGDLVNISDVAVEFKQYLTEDGLQVRELTKVLRRSNEE